MFAIALPAARTLARIFTSEPEVIDYTRWYLWILLPGAIGLNRYNWTSEALNASGRPKWVVVINVAGTLVILIPLTVLGSRIGGYHGMLAGLCTGQLFLGFLATRVGKRELSGRGAAVPVAAGAS